MPSLVFTAPFIESAGVGTRISPEIPFLEVPGHAGVQRRAVIEPSPLESVGMPSIEPCVAAGADSVVVFMLCRADVPVIGMAMTMASAEPTALDQRQAIAMAGIHNDNGVAMRA